MRWEGRDGVSEASESFAVSLSSFVGSNDCFALRLEERFEIRSL